MDILKVVVDALQIGEYATSIDLKDAYFHVGVHVRDTKYLRFVVGDRVFEFQVLPFGLSTSPRVFTRVVRALVAYLRKRGLKMFAYLDDWLLSNRDRQLLIRQTALAVSETEGAGFIINREKSELTPSLRPVFLGALLDMTAGLVRPSMPRLETLELYVWDLLNRGAAPALFWLQMLGRMASCKGLVPFSMLNMRLIQICLQSQWNRSLPMSVEVTFPDALVPHLRWWTDRNNTLCGVPFHPMPPSVILTTDASDEGWGGHIDDLSVSGKWEKEVQGEHVNLLELRAVFRSLKKFQEKLRGTTVLVQSDNTTVVAYINKEGGTRSVSLCLMTLDLFQWCRSNAIQLKASHLPGTQNLLADDLSRGRVSPIEWALNREVVKVIFQQIERPLIDLFASAENATLPTFCSRLHHPQAFWQDEFRLDWTNLQAYAYPPISLIRRVLAKMEAEPCRILLIAPLCLVSTGFSALSAF